MFYSLVKQSHVEDEANVMLEWINGELHIKVCCPVDVGSELLCWLTESQDSSTCLKNNILAHTSDGELDTEKKTLQKMPVITTTKTRDLEEETLLQKEDSPGFLCRYCTWFRNFEFRKQYHTSFWQIK